MVINYQLETSAELSFADLEEIIRYSRTKSIFTPIIEEVYYVQDIIKAAQHLGFLTMPSGFSITDNAYKMLQVIRDENNKIISVEID